MTFFIYLLAIVRYKNFRSSPGGSESSEGTEISAASETSADSGIASEWSPEI